MESFISLFDPNADENDSENTEENNNFVLPPEPQVGNVEYKLKIVNPSKQRFEHLVTQMKWRLREGKGEALYEIGVEDNGYLSGLSTQDLAISLANLELMATKLGATTNIIRTKQLQNGRSIAEILIQKMPYNQKSEIRVAAVGSTQSGKSTVLGVLVEGILDNGRGSARLNMFRHLHEIQSGYTSCVSHEFVGFNSQGNSLTNKTGTVVSADEIFETCSKLVTLFDLPGLNKYTHTTVKGLCGYSPHYVMLVISDSQGANSTTVDHLQYVSALKIPFFVVITKIDMQISNDKEKMLETLFLQANIERKPLFIKNIEDLPSSMKQDDSILTFTISNTTGQGLEVLANYLYMLPSYPITDEDKQLQKALPEFRISEHFKVAEKQQVLGGLTTKGAIREGMKMKVGPHKDGSFSPVTVRSIHRFRFPCRMLRMGQIAAVCVDTYIEDLRNGMVLVSENEEACGTFYFQALMSVMYHSTAIYPGYEAIVHVDNVRQPASVVGIFPCNSIHMNEKESVLFKFKMYPEYLRTGQRILFIEGKSKCTGQITQVFPMYRNTK